MDWYLESRDTAAVPRLRREIMTYLRRHGVPGTDPGDAELVVSELLANALEHTAGPVWVSLSWDGPHPTLSVADLGPGFSPEAILRGRSRSAGGSTDRFTQGRADPSAGDLPEPPDLLADHGRGLFIATALARDLAVAAREAGGSVVSATLDVVRAPARPARRPRTDPDPLPSPDEASASGGFGREALLRALVVQLVHAVELQHGPDAVHEAINQVGVDVGHQLEAEFRAVRGLAGRLTPDQLAECLVRLKQRIGGEFAVAEVSADLLVLTATRCPFGPAVTRTPALCRLTAGVFGGIATRNTADGEATVLLEQRIAVGDAACRVVVRLDPDAEAAPADVRRYLAPR